MAYLSYEKASILAHAFVARGAVYMAAQNVWYCYLPGSSYQPMPQLFDLLYNYVLASILQLNYSETTDDDILDWIIAHAAYGTDQLSSTRALLWVPINAYYGAATAGGTLTYATWWDSYGKPALEFAATAARYSSLSSAGGSGSSWDSTAVSDLVAAVNAVAVPVQSNWGDFDGF